MGSNIVIFQNYSRLRSTTDNFPAELTNTVRCRYNSVIFLTNIHKRHPIARPLGVFLWIQGAVSIRKTVLPGMAIPMLKIRRPNGRLIFNMEIAIRR